MMLARVALTVIVIGIAGLAVSGAQTPALPAGFTVTPVFDNTTASVVRLQLAPGAREQPHTHTYPMLVVLLSRSEMEMHNGTSHTKASRHPGHLEFVKAGVPHHAANVGTMPLDALVLSIKPDRARAGATPPAQATPGVTRTSLLDNADVTVTRLEFEADMREPLHTHPYDLIVVPTTLSRVDLQIGNKKEMRSYAVGEAIFIKRHVPHAVANIGAAPFRALAVAIK
jgi:quercetin dioxygenase-like cupin family protein